MVADCGDGKWDAKCKERRDSCRTYVERIISDQEKQIDLKLKAAESALVLAKKENEHRLLSLNQYKEAMEKERGEFVKREYFNSVRETNDKWREDVSNRLTTIETRSVTWVAALGIFFLIFQLLIWLLER